MSTYSKNAVGQYTRNTGAINTAAFTADVNIVNRADVSASSYTCTLPTAASATGLIVHILITSNDPLYELTVVGDGGELIDGVSDIYLQATACSDLYSD